MKATIELVKEAISEAEVIENTNDLDVDIPLIEQGCDSLDVVNVYMVIEEKFKIKIPDADLSKLLTINNMVDYINQKQQSEESL